MASIITQTIGSGEEWLSQLADVVTEPLELLQILQIKQPKLQAGAVARKLFPLRVPRSFIARMRLGDANDPLLRQVLTSSKEFMTPMGFSADPLQEQQQAVVVPGLLHKYPNRVLMLLKGGCAINCRYCFRRHFPYQAHPSGKKNWQHALTYIATHPELDEVILSGGDPLMAKDDELEWLITQLEEIPHLSFLRIHTRLPIVIPTRVTEKLCHCLGGSRFQTVVVTHVNHANEINTEVTTQLLRLRSSGVTLLNQSVLLRGVNDNLAALLNLSHTLFKAGILPYYLHMLDKVQGAAHFMVSDKKAKALHSSLLDCTAGYLVPRLVREVSVGLSKVPLTR